MFVLHELKINKSELMKRAAELVKERKAEGVSSLYQWTNKAGESKVNYLSKMTRGEIIEMLWDAGRTAINNYYKDVNKDIEATMAGIKKEQATIAAKNVINNIKTIDDFKAVLPQLKISNKTWWKMATEANIDDKVKRYGYGRLAA